MQIQLRAPKIWLAKEAVDFRKGLDGLSGYVATHYNQSLEDHIYIFYNTTKDKLKLLAYHRNGHILIYKRLDKKKFIVKHKSELIKMDEKQLSWLLAGLDWSDMFSWNELIDKDYF